MNENEISPTPFVDWCGIWTGHGGTGPDDLSWIQDPPMGELQLKVQPARWSEPFLHEKEHPWEARSLIPLMVLREGDRLRAWYQCTGENGLHYDAYAESDDGLNWEKPQPRPGRVRGGNGQQPAPPAHPFRYTQPVHRSVGT